MKITQFKKLIMGSQNFNVSIEHDEVNENIVKFNGTFELNSHGGNSSMTIKELSNLMLSKFDDINKKFDAKFDEVNIRLDQMDKRLDQMDKRLDQIDTNLVELGKRIDNIVVKNNLIE